MINTLKMVCLFLAVLGLHCCMRGFSIAMSGGYSRCSVLASHLGGFSCGGAQALGSRASVVVVHGLSSFGSWAGSRAQTH